MPTAFSRHNWPQLSAASSVFRATALFLSSYTQVQSLQFSTWRSCGVHVALMRCSHGAHVAFRRCLRGVRILSLHVLPPSQILVNSRQNVIMSPPNLFSTSGAAFISFPLACQIFQALILFAQNVNFYVIVMYSLPEFTLSMIPLSYTVARGEHHK